MGTSSEMSLPEPIRDAQWTSFRPNRNKQLKDDELTARQGGSDCNAADESAVYYPEDLLLLGNVLDGAVASLPTCVRTPENRKAIARNIFACAAAGERDPVRLELAALMNLSINAAA